MLKYDRIKLAEGTDVNKTYGLCKCIICHYWYFLEKNFRFQPELCNGCHDLMLKVMSFKMKLK